MTGAPRVSDMTDTPKSFLLTAELHRYLLAHATPVDAIQQRLIDRTAELGSLAGMQIAPEQGAFMTLLTTLVGARRAVEVGTFTGYSALAIARGLPDDGLLLCCDVSEEWTSIGAAAWADAGVAEKIELVIAPAVDTLRALPAEETFDLAFIDADKPSYPLYYEEILTRLRPNGVILVDNVLWSGEVIKADASDDNTVALREFNDLVAADSRVESVILPISDGITLIRKR
jgi:caffeoyl-CoA O-methyltransferase